MAWVGVGQVNVAEVLEQLRQLKQVSQEYTGDVWSATRQASDSIPALGRARGFAERYARELNRLAEVAVSSLH